MSIDALFQYLDFFKLLQVGRHRNTVYTKTTFSLYTENSNLNTTGLFPKVLLNRFCVGAEFDDDVADVISGDALFGEE